jgi:hypothetical protein
MNQKDPFSVLKADFSCQEPEHDGEEHGWAEEGRGLEGGKQRGREQGQQAQVSLFSSSFLHIYYLNSAAFSSSCCTSDFILNITGVFLTQIDWRIN